MNREFPDVKAGFRKGRGIRDQITNIHWIIEKAREFQKNIYSCFFDFINYPKASDCVKWSEVKVAQSCLTLCDRMDYTVHGILQARILEWVAFLFSRGSSQPRDQTQVSCIAGRFFTRWATKEAQEFWSGWPIPSPADLPDPGIELGSPALQADSLPTELCVDCVDHNKLRKILQETAIPHHITYHLRNLYAGQEATELHME